MMNGKLILVNGPPRSGKDTVGQILQSYHESSSPRAVYLAKMAGALKTATHALYSELTKDVEFPLKHDAFEAVKDQPCDEFLGATPRQAYIAVSEQLVKPLHGQSTWGRILANNLSKDWLARDAADYVVVTDSGFAPEAIPLMELFGVENTVLLHLYRPGTDFSKDSRNYIRLPGINSVPGIVNDGSLYDLAVKLQEHIPGFKIHYHVDVSIAVGSDTAMWFEQGGKRPSLAQALAVVEALRRGEYGKCSMRVRAGSDHVLQTINPGDAPVTELL